MRGGNGEAAVRRHGEVLAGAIEIHHCIAIRQSSRARSAIFVGTGVAASQVSFGARAAAHTPISHRVIVQDGEVVRGANSAGSHGGGRTAAFARMDHMQPCKHANCSKNYHTQQGLPHSNRTLVLTNALF